MIEKIGIFIIFLGPLIFFHELGHFFFARLFGVKVEVFSIGFGPKILKFKRGATEYALSLIPLGGYVKMFGDDPLGKDEIPEEQRGESFTFKGKWARFWIVMGGPLANFILAYVIFFALLMVGEKTPEIKIGVVPETSNFYSKGIRSGDVITKVNGIEISGPTDIPVDGKDLVQTISVSRDSVLNTLSIDMSAENFFNEYKNYPPFMRKPIIVNQAGELFMLSSSEKGIDWKISLSELRRKTSGTDLYFYKVLASKELKEKSNEETTYTQQGKTYSSKLAVNAKTYSSFLTWLGSKGYRIQELSIKNIKMNSAADKAGMRSGDIITALNGKKVYSFDQLKTTLQEAKEESVSVSLWKNGSVKKITLTPAWDNHNGKKVKIMGVLSGGSYLPLKYVETKSKGIFVSMGIAFSRTYDSLFKTLDAFKKLLLKEVPFNQVGGPLRIGKAASDSFNTSLSYFFQLMALISVNLGVINLFPIPVLDGGHIMFIFLELVNRGPVSRRKMEIAQQIGLSLLLMLMVGAIFNDFSWYFSN